MRNTKNSAIEEEPLKAALNLKIDEITCLQDKAMDDLL